NRLDLLEKLLPVYIELLQKIQNTGASWIQIDEPFLVMDAAEDLQEQYKVVFQRIAKEVPGLRVILATYFGGLDNCTNWVAKLPVYALHIDLVRGKEGFARVLESLHPKINLSLGIVDGRNIWKNDYKNSLVLIEKATRALGSAR